MRWGYVRLFAREQRVLRAASMFEGGFEAAARTSLLKSADLAVDNMVEILGQLGHKHLVETAGRPSCWLLHIACSFLRLEVVVEGEREVLERAYAATMDGTAT